MATVTGAAGVWSAPVYEAVATPFTPGAGIIVGANIKLVFTPALASATSSDIRLIQFKNPIVGSGWQLDRAAAATTPFYKWNDATGAAPMTDVGNMASLKGEPLCAGKGGATSGKRVAPAFLIDTPREPTAPLAAGAMLSAIFSVYAYDGTNRAWLGGVTWGYILTGMPGGAGPGLAMRDLKLKTKGAPPNHYDPATPTANPTEEVAAAQLWLTNPPAGRNPLPPW